MRQLGTRRRAENPRDHRGKRRVRAALPTLAWALLLLLGLGGCESESAANDTAAAEDTAEPEDTAVGDSGDTSSDSSADTGSADASDTSGDSSTDAAGSEVQVVDKGCKSTSDCANLVLSSCQSASCDLKTGLCQFANLPDDSTCTGAEADKCKLDPRCKAGQCAFSMLSCDDGNGCTADTCEASAGCVSTAVSGPVVPCLDGSACTVSANCAQGVCTKIKGLDCDDQEACTSDACDPKLGCTHEPVKDGQSCSDGKFCTEKDGCKKGACTGAPVVCSDDGNPCTVAQCAEQAKGCSNAPLEDLFCDDGKPCTTKDICDGSGTCAGVPTNCDDKNPCTDDFCDAVAGCLHKDNAQPCSGDACMAAGKCSEGKCAGAPLSCDDGNLCTQDTCDKVLGCQAKAWPSPCWDGNACTTEDTCTGGACKGGGQLQCSDSNPCSVDACDPAQGCSHVAAAPGASCGGGQTCTAGICLPAKCGDGWCASAESAANCPGDCPEDGGACQPSDSACLASCTAAKCKAQADDCNAVSGCKDLGACLSGCGSDLSCMVQCLVGAPGSSGEAFAAYDQCMQAFCIKDFWMGKKCSGAGNQYIQCVDACEGAMCKSLSLQCKASTGCSAVRDCLKGCTDANPVPCITACKAKGSEADTLLNAKLDDCDKNYCL